MEDGAAMTLGDAGRISCPYGGSFWSCADGSRFVGCCVVNPCTTGCNSSYLLPAQLISGFGTIPDAECDEGEFYTCDSIVQRYGCCKSSPCGDNTGCPGENLTSAFWIEDASSSQFFIDANATIETAKQERAQAAQDASAAGLEGNPTNGAGLLPTATTAAITTITAGPSSTTSPSSAAPAQLSAGSIAGVAIGCLAFVVLILALLYLLRKRRRNHTKKLITQKEVIIEPRAWTREVPASGQENDARKLAWRAPFIIIGSFVAALVFAVGHHILYSSLDGQETSAGRHRIAGQDISTQQLTNAGSTALVFLVKAFLVLCASSAYVQICWRAIMQAEHTIKSIDDLLSALTDVFAAAGIFKFYELPLIPLLALVVWLLPIATVFAPAALTINFDIVPHPPVQNLAVPVPAFASFSIAAWRTTQSVRGSSSENPISELQYQSPNQEVLRIANAAAASGAILPIAPPAANASWHVDFDGPSVQCQDVDDLSSVQTNLQQVMRESVTTSSKISVSQSHCLDASRMFTFLSWQQNGSESLAPFDEGELRLAEVVMGDLFVAVIPSAAGPLIQHEQCVHGLEPFGDAGMATFFENATILQCSFGNSTYHVDFDYTGTTGQRIKTTLDLREAHSQAPATGLLQAGVSRADQFALQPLVRDGPDFPATNTMYAQIDANILRQWSYQATAAAFKSIVLGAIGRGSLEGASLVSSDGNGSSIVRNYRTPIFSSVLSQSKELNMLIPGAPTAYGLTTQFPSSTGYGQAFAMLPHENNRTDYPPLKDALEELFCNITISMASSARLQYNTSSLFAPANVSVTFNNYANLFVYRPERLWLAYGIALGATALCAIAGLVAIFTSNASYTTRFSTMLRVTQNARLSKELPRERQPGKDPLPREVADVTIRVVGSRELSSVSSIEKTQYTKMEQHVEEGEIDGESISMVRDDGS